MWSVHFGDGFCGLTSPNWILRTPEEKTYIISPQLILFTRQFGDRRARDSRDTGRPFVTANITVWGGDGGW